jgi:AcrR family transcriptional regulator
VSSDTRSRIVDASAELFRRQGYSGTGVKQIVAAAEAPFGSLYHFFPGGKEQLGAAVIRWSGRQYARVGEAALAPAPDVVSGVRAFFAAAARDLRDSGYADACPIAMVALEVSSVSEPMREACAEVFEGWIAGLAARFQDAGIAPAAARELAIAMLAGLEGAFVLSRALRSTEPLSVAGETAAARVGDALAQAGRGPGRRGDGRARGRSGSDGGPVSRAAGGDTARTARRRPASAGRSSRTGPSG